MEELLHYIDVTKETLTLLDNKLSHDFKYADLDDVNEVAQLIGEFEARITVADGLLEHIEEVLRHDR